MNTQNPQSSGERTQPDIRANGDPNRPGDPNPANFQSKFDKDKNDPGKRAGLRPGEEDENEKSAPGKNQDR